MVLKYHSHSAKLEYLINKSLINATGASAYSRVDVDSTFYTKDPIPSYKDFLNKKTCVLPAQQRPSFHQNAGAATALSCHSRALELSL